MEVHHLSKLDEEEAEDAEKPDPRVGPGETWGLFPSADSPLPRPTPTKSANADGRTHCAPELGSRPGKQLGFSEGTTFKEYEEYKVLQLQYEEYKVLPCANSPLQRLTPKETANADGRTHVFVLPSCAPELGSRSAEQLGSSEGTTLEQVSQNPAVGFAIPFSGEEVPEHNPHRIVSNRDQRWEKVESSGYQLLSRACFLGLRDYAQELAQGLLQTDNSQQARGSE